VQRPCLLLGHLREPQGGAHEEVAADAAGDGDVPLHVEAHGSGLDEEARGAVGRVVAPPAHRLAGSRVDLLGAHPQGLTLVNFSAQHIRWVRGTFGVFLRRWFGGVGRC